MNQQIAGPKDVAQLGTILTVWAHPDDETFCAGGLLAAAVQNGQRVICVTATKGEAGSQDLERWPSKNMGSVRQDELDAALKILGITEHHFLDYHDGACASADQVEAANQVTTFITKYQPDTILTFGPDGLTGHPDHATVSGWVDDAVELANHKPTIYHAVLTVGQYKKYLQAADAKLNLFFNIEHPPLVPKTECDICFSCTDELCACKQDAFAAMPSQYEKMMAAFDQQYLSEAFRVEAFVKTHVTTGVCL
jgi:LmbE family N-acetylglucosaminyl deacetylase